MRSQPDPQHRVIEPLNLKHSTPGPVHLSLLSQWVAVRVLTACYGFRHF